MVEGVPNISALYSRFYLFVKPIISPSISASNSDSVRVISKKKYIEFTVDGLIIYNLHLSCQKMVITRL